MNEQFAGEAIAIQAVKHVGSWGRVSPNKLRHVQHVPGSLIQYIAGGNGTEIKYVQHVQYTSFTALIGQQMDS